MNLPKNIIEIRTLIAKQLILIYQKLFYRFFIARTLSLIVTVCIFFTCILAASYFNEYQRSADDPINLSMIGYVVSIIVAILCGFMFRFAQLASYRSFTSKKLRSLVRTTLDSAVDGILVVNKDGNLIDYNQRFIDMWTIPGDEIDRLNQSQLVNMMKKRLIDMTQFNQKINQIIHSPAEEFVDELHLKNGRVFECITKPQWFNNKIIGRIWYCQDLTWQTSLEKQLSYQATHDLLTGLPNRVYLIDLVNRAIELAKKNQAVFAIILMDLDRFSIVNKIFGRSKGDDCLNIIAQRVKDTLPSEYTLGRIGGDEFLIISNPLQNPDRVISIVQHLIEALSVPFNFFNHQLTISCSIGVSLYPQDGETVDILMGNADIAKSEVKNTERNNYLFYNKDMHAYTLDYLQLENQLRCALPNNELCLHYQPIINIQNEKLIGFEALIRWNNPVRGMVSPEVFIPLAEEIGLIREIDDWVMMTACQQMKTWHDSGFSELQIAVNISSAQFKYGFLTQTVAKVLTTTQLPPEKLELEITEGMLIDDTKSANSILYELKQLNIQIVLDDFGTGYSCLSYLKRFDIDKLKIDKSFVNHLPQNKEDEILVKTIISMAKNFKMDVVAEGIETKEQLEILQRLGCDFGQGFYFSRSMSLEQCHDYLQKMGKK